MSTTDKFRKEYFEERSKSSRIFLRHPFWNKYIRQNKECGRLLDIGCAEGALLSWANKQTYECHGIDVSKHILEKVKRDISPNVSIYVSDAHSLPFKDNSFDVMTCFDVLEHLSYPKDCIGEIFRCLRIGGIFVLSVPNIDSIGRDLKGHQWFGYRDTTHMTLLSSDEWYTMVKDCGFTVTDCFYDALWDPPYSKNVPKFLQIGLFRFLDVLFNLGLVRFPRHYGENYYIVAQKGTKTE